MNRKLLLCATLMLAACSLVSSQSLFDSIRVARSGEIFFATGEATLSADALTTIDTLCAFFQRNRRAEGIRITAHTDSVGTFEKNLALSQRRADSVRAVLLQRGIAPEKIALNFFGESRPAADNDTEAGRQRNRRATIDVLIRIPMTSLSGRVVDQETGKGVLATVVFSYKELSDSTHTDTTGYYSARLPENIPVKVDAFSRGYFFESVMRNTFGSKEMVQRMAEDNKKEIRLQPARPGQKAVLKNFYFRGGMPTLLESSKPQLPKVLRFMQINPGIKIEIAGHINLPFSRNGDEAPLQPGDPNWDLSEKRAQTVYDYLLEHGISPDRMTWKGYGNSQMVKPYAKYESDMELNRRVEIRVLEK